MTNKGLPTATSQTILRTLVSYIVYLAAVMPRHLGITEDSVAYNAKSEGRVLKNLPTTGVSQAGTQLFRDLDPIKQKGIWRVSRR